MGLWSWTQAPFFPWNMRQVENVVLQRVRAVTRRRVGQHLHHLSTTSTEAGNRKEQNNPNCNTNMKENSNISKKIISSYEFPSLWSVCGFLMSLFPQETIVWFQESMIIISIGNSFSLTRMPFLKKTWQHSNELKGAKIVVDPGI